MTETPAAPVERSPLAPTPLIPESFAAKYREAGYWIDQTIPEFLLDACRAKPHFPALVALSHAVLDEKGKPVQVRYSYGELEAAGRAAAKRLIEAGVQPGDRVLLQLPNIAEYLVYLLGVFWASALPVFCLPQHRLSELSHFATRTDAAAHIYSSKTAGTNFTQLHEELTEALREAGEVAPPVGIDASVPLEPLSEEELAEPFMPGVIQNTDSTRASEQVAFLQLSGGTTGVSKLIPRTHAAYLYSVRGSVDICRIHANTTMLIVLPAAHNFTMSSPGILGAMCASAKMVFAGDPSPQTAFRLIQMEGVTFTALVPPLAQAWAASAERNPVEIPSLRTLQVGGSKLSPAVAGTIAQALEVEIQQVFGMAEGLVNYTRRDDDPYLQFNTQGRPISPDDEVLIVDDNDQPVARGESGHLLTRGPYTIRGYYLEENANRFGFTEDGFYRTGDIVRWNGPNLEVTGRAKDQINRNGEKIAVDEIEDIALAHPDVFDAVVLGLPDDTVGERVALVLVPKPGASFGENPRRTMHEYFSAAQLADFKIPERVEVMDELPTTNVGKISRRELRVLLADMLAS